MLTHYYNQNTGHGYMNVENCDPVIFDYLKKLNLEDSNVLEIGSGFGRYTHPLSLLSKKVLATEPNEHMYNNLSENYKGVENVRLINKSLQELISHSFDEQIEVSVAAST